MARKSKPRREKVATVTLPRVAVADAIAALDGCEQLIELLKGPLNGGDEIFAQDMLSLWQDRVIVAVRIRLALAIRYKG